MSERSAELTLVEAGADGAAFVRDLSAEVFARFGDYETTLPAWMGLPWIRTVIARSGERPVGFVMYTSFGLPEGETELLAIAVLPESQSQGVGRHMLAEVERAAREQARGGPAAVRLTVAEDNTRALRVFRRAGYTSASEDRGTYPRGQLSLDLRKRLAPAIKAD
jgi:ribosomal protein S18 acetylase RimI-like enzyme